MITDCGRQKLLIGFSTKPNMDSSDHNQHRMRDSRNSSVEQENKVL